jgi:hypothetical protein
LTLSPFRDGDFVWTNFPEREDPLRPGPLHVSYVLIAGDAPSGVFSVMAAYTSSRQWPSELPFGVHRFDRLQAERFGQSRPFVLDLRRIAYLPVTAAWFPHLETEGRGVLGRAPEPLRATLLREANELFRRRKELLERLGPLWSG